MNARAKISSKGQLVLPKAIRDAFGPGPGSAVDSENAGETIVLRPLPKKSGSRRVYTLDEVAGMLKYDGPPVHRLGVDLADALHLLAAEKSNEMLTFDDDFVKRAKRMSGALPVRIPPHTA